MFEEDSSAFKDKKTKLEGLKGQLHECSSWLEKKPAIEMQHNTALK